MHGNTGRSIEHLTQRGNLIAYDTRRPMSLAPPRMHDGKKANTAHGRWKGVPEDANGTPYEPTSGVRMLLPPSVTLAYPGRLRADRLRAAMKDGTHGERDGTA